MVHDKQNKEIAKEFYYHVDVIFRPLSHKYGRNNGNVKAGFVLIQSTEYIKSYFAHIIRFMEQTQYLD